MPTNDWWVQSPDSMIGQANLASCAVTTSDIAARNVTSETLSLNAVTRVNTIAVPALTTCSSLGSSALGSTGYVLMRASVSMQVQRVTIIPQSDVAALNATCNGIVWWVGNGCSTMAMLQATSTAAITAGSLTQILSAALSNTTVAACSDIRFAITLSSCGTWPASVVQLDYLSTA